VKIEGLEDSFSDIDLIEFSCPLSLLSEDAALATELNERLIRLQCDLEDRLSRKGCKRFMRLLFLESVICLDNPVI
jgi:hypothetical protein